MIQIHGLRVDKKRDSIFDFIIWHRRDRLSCNQMAIIVLLSGIRDRAVPGLTSIRDYCHRIIHANSDSVSEKDKNVLVVFFLPDSKDYQN